MAAEKRASPQRGGQLSGGSGAAPPGPAGSLPVPFGGTRWPPGLAVPRRLSLSPVGVVSLPPGAPHHADVPDGQLLARELVELAGPVRAAGHPAPVPGEEGELLEHLHGDLGRARRGPASGAAPMPPAPPACPTAEGQPQEAVRLAASSPSCPPQTPQPQHAPQLLLSIPHQER